MVLRRHPSEHQGRLCVRLGAGGLGTKQTEDRLQHGEKKLISAWRAPAAWGTLD